MLRNIPKSCIFERFVTKVYCVIDLFGLKTNLNEDVSQNYLLSQIRLK